MRYTKKQKLLIESIKLGGGFIKRGAFWFDERGEKYHVSTVDSLKHGGIIGIGHSGGMLNCGFTEICRIDLLGGQK